MVHCEDNIKNPTIMSEDKSDFLHDFILRYKDDDVKKNMTRIVLRLVEEYELSAFHIEDKKAYEKNRIIYNNYTIAEDNDFSDYKKISKEFVKRLS